MENDQKDIYVGNLSNERYIQFFKLDFTSELALAECGHQIPYCKKLPCPKLTEHYLLHFVKGGNGYFRLVDRTYRVGPNQCFLIYPDQLALYLTDPGKKWEYYWIMVNGTKVPEILEAIGFSRDNQVISFQDDDIFSRMSDILDSALTYQTDPLGIDLHTSSLIRPLFFSLIRQKRSRKVTPVPSYPEDNSNLLVYGLGHNYYISHVTKYIHAHFQEQISVESLAESLHLNRSYLSTLFRAHSGMSIMQYLQHYRILHAITLLERSNKSIKEIASDVGFSDAMYFSRLFKKHTGMTPSEYRIDCQSKQAGDKAFLQRKVTNPHRK